MPNQERNPAPGNIEFIGANEAAISSRQAEKKKNSKLSPDATEKLYNKMVEEIRDCAILLLDNEGNILNWNRGAADIKGYEADEIIGKHFSVFYMPDDRKALTPQSLLKTAYENGKATHEGWRLKKDGTKFWGSVVITALHGDNNEVIGFSKLTRDLTERKTAEENLQRNAWNLEQKNEELKRSEERYHRMIAEVEDYAIIMLDKEGNILNWNKGAEKIKGYKEQEIIGKNFRSFYRTADREAQLPEKLLANAVAHNKASHEGWRMRKDGSQFWGSIVITALHDSEGQVTGFSKVTRDLTQKKEFEDFIMMQNKQLQEYAYVASHDLQEPLRKIMLFSGLVNDKIDDRNLALQYLKKINSSADRMTNLIRAVLVYSQTSDNNGLKTDVDLNVIVADIESDFEMLLKEKSGKISYGKLPTVYAIPIQMHQLFSNLINNAIKFSAHEPEVTITSEILHNNFIRICIADNGIGFNPEYSEKIFKMFHRLDNTANGTGIGLALCKRVVENHGGTITASGKEGKGATFEVVLPQAAPKKGPDPDLAI